MLKFKNQIPKPEFRAEGTVVDCAGIRNMSSWLVWETH